MNAGRLIGVVGPSGAGKDSVMEALARARPDFHLVRRVITRAEGAGGEVYERVSPGEFERRRAVGEFVLHWRAHDIDYGIPATLYERLAAGQTCLVNLSRAVLAQAENRFRGFIALHVTAPVDVLARRLAARGRENEEEIAARLRRSSFALPAGLSRVIDLANDGPLDETVARALDALQDGRRGQR